jgi:rhodanese-related sulfurtransferase
MLLLKGVYYVGFGMMSARNIAANDGVPTLEGLCEVASSRTPAAPAYAGEVTPLEAWNFMLSHDAQLIDVRTQPEWQFVGVPDMTGTRAKLHTIAWKHYPTFTINTQFAQQLQAAGCVKEQPIFFLCRSGGRSRDAAIAMTEAGFRYCFNIIDGFEGEPDGMRHRGASAGWKASNLPWMQG